MGVSLVETPRTLADAPSAPPSVASGPRSAQRGVHVSRPRRVLFISHNSLLEPLGRSQVVPYVAGLAHAGHFMTILSFSAPGDEKHATEEADLRVELTHNGIKWVTLPRRRGNAFRSKVLDVLFGLLVALRLCLRHRIEIVHARSHLPAALGLLLKFLLR